MLMLLFHSNSYIMSHYHHHKTCFTSLPPSFQNLAFELQFIFYLNAFKVIQLVLEEHFFDKTVLEYKGLQ